MTMLDDRNFPAMVITTEEQFTNSDIRNAELERARHALAYLKRKISNDTMRDLLEGEIAEMTAPVRGWVEASRGVWQTDSVEMVVIRPTAEDFYKWYSNALTNSREPELRAGHPEHFISHPRAGGIEVVENIGETDLRWRIIYQMLPKDVTSQLFWKASSYSQRYSANYLVLHGIIG
ncbi:MAG: hypothetical protein V7L20_18280 [Nostoc sp.]|uniref:hypothetical protein n=1 Tax=Nostoc sp. TaxID=1180 RepID=UPI002FFAADDB